MSPREFDEAAVITAYDKNAARALWRESVDPKFRNLLDAKKEEPK
jgi:hypothetical protein